MLFVFVFVGEELPVSVCEKPSVSDWVLLLVLVPLRPS
ncbi:hypothetical protein EMEDMD4_130057 [Sinorhizobium medicae]|uniref:Uncharacterized protein n=1 Tax=Sinorhizobium medicae TaxID=110321 RepID=A0A508WVE8_9HYPH|nr:hypothetical protein EMEDMD4_130057 [Sinorhizobium medicae]